MTRALQLAEQGLYTTMPNPRVGCVIVKDGKIIGEGAHLKAGEPHAEVFALRQAGEQAKGATVICNARTMQPHRPHATLLASHCDAGVAKVIAAMQDPNPQVAGSGLAYLQSHNIETACGLMQAQARSTKPRFYLAHDAKTAVCAQQNRRKFRWQNRAE